jgi:hypothetical protein
VLFLRYRLLRMSLEIMVDPQEHFQGLSWGMLLPDQAHLRNHWPNEVTLGFEVF